MRREGESIRSPFYYIMTTKLMAVTAFEDALKAKPNEDVPILNTTYSNFAKYY